MKKTIVVSGINLFEGGTLRVYYNFCDEIIDAHLDEKYHIILFVHKLSLFEKYRDHFEIIELPDSRKSWLNRIKYEYFYFKKYSKDKEISLWVSIHDMTPRVHAEHEVTYFHNPTFAHKADRNDFKYSRKVFLFSLFYKYLYKLNVKANDFVIAQQDWIAEAISSALKLDRSRIIVMPAEHKIEFHEVDSSNKMNPYMFFFPSVSRHFKNFEIICEASHILNEHGYKDHFQVYLTIDGSENLYAKEIVDKYGNENNIHFCGLLQMEQVFEYYKKASCLIFPSKMETWGLPISEAKQFSLPILVADLPYAHETVGNYDRVCFFDEKNADELANYMLRTIKGENIFHKATYRIKNKNVCYQWPELIEKVLKENSHDISGNDNI